MLLAVCELGYVNYASLFRLQNGINFNTYLIDCHDSSMRNLCKTFNLVAGDQKTELTISVTYHKDNYYHVEKSISQ